MIDIRNVFIRKIFILLSLILVLSLANLLVLYFNSDKTYQRNSVYTWLDERYLSYVDKIEISGPQGTIVLNRKNNVWVMSVPFSGSSPAGNSAGSSAIDLPIKQYRVDDLLNTLSRRRNYPVRSSASPEILGLGQTASHITIHGGSGLPLLDLLIGLVDVSGREIYLRKAGQREIRSGIDQFSLFLESPPSFWYDLRLFPDITPDMVQKVYLVPFNGEEDAVTLSRRNNGWIIEETGLPFAAGESWVRSIAEAQAEDFVFLSGREINDIEVCGSIILELGNGAIKRLNIDLPQPDGNRIAVVSGSPYFYSLTEWTINRLWRDAVFFAEP